MFNIEMLPAENGDSLLVSYGERDDAHYVLIDGGPCYDYRNRQFLERDVLDNRLQTLIDAGDALELLVMTHIDADHIEGILKLLSCEPLDLRIDDVWYNAWRHLSPQPEDLLGPVQGEMLSALIQERNLPWNVAFDGGAVMVHPDQPLPSVTLPGGLTLTLLSPTPDRLADLRKTWASRVRKAGLDPDSPDEALERLKRTPLRPDDLLGEPRPDVDELAAEAFHCDRSAANGSSIAFLAEFEGKRCLFAGDAHPPVLEASVRRLLDGNGASRLQLDVFKVPHHGSNHNLSPELLDLVACDQYLISTSGRYFSHPARETIARIIDRGGDNPTLCFNYRSHANEVWDDVVLKEQHGYRTRYQNGQDQGLLIEL